MSIELINLHSMMSAAISPVTSSTSVLFKVIASEAFTKHKNLVLETANLATGSHLTTDNAQTIWIYDKAFAFWSDA